MNILLTGANGFLGGKITKRILKDTSFDIVAVAASDVKVEEMCVREGLNRSRIHFLSNCDFLNPKTSLNDVFAAIHLAFARQIRPAEDIAASIDFSAAVFNKLAECKVERVINMSSQGVYGGTKEIRTEKTKPAPGNQYTMAKYASEVLFNEILKECRYHTSLRLDLVAQSQNVIRGLCKSAREGRINLVGGRQMFSFIDADDAAKAVNAMLKVNDNWEAVYNVGWNRKRYTLVELAEIASDAAVHCGFSQPEIEWTQSDISLFSGMDSSLFMCATGWKPEIEIRKTMYEILRS